MQQALVICFLGIGMCLISWCSISTWPAHTTTTTATQQTGGALGSQGTPQTVSPKEEKKEIPLDWRTVQTTIKEISRQGKPATCTFSQDAEDGTAFVGIAYMLWSKIRVATKGKVWWKSITMNMLLDDGFIHTRTSRDPWKWYKIKDNASPEKWNNDAENIWVLDKEMSFSCSWWAKAHLFSLPKDIDFQESWQ